MKDILDEDYSAVENELEDKRSKHKLSKSILYFVIMIIGGAFYSYHEFLGSYNAYVMANGAFTLIGMAFFLAVISESIRYYLRRRRTKKYGANALHDPFWYQLVESGFAYWLFIMFIIVVGNNV